MRSEQATAFARKIRRTPILGLYQPVEKVFDRTVFSRRETLRLFLCLFLAPSFLITALPVEAQTEPEFFYTVDAPAENEGSFDAVCRLTASGVDENDSGPAGWSISLVVRGGTVTDITTVGTAVDEFSGGPGNTFETTQLGTDNTDSGIVSAVVLGLSEPVFLPPTGTFDTLRFSVDTSGHCETELFFRDGLRGFGQPVKNRVTHRIRSFVPSSETTTSRTGAAPVDAGPDGLGEELTSFTLKGTGGDEGEATSFQWKQISGPAVSELEGGETMALNLVLPPVDGDQEVVFELALEQGDCTATDRAAVTVIDGDLRAFNVAPKSSAVTLEDGRVVLFDGNLTWGTGLEDATWGGVRFTASGAGDESELVSGLALYLDSDGSGALDSEDELLGEETLGKNNGSVLFDFSSAPLAVSEGSPVRFLLVATRAASNAGSVAFVFPLALVSFLSGLVLRRSNRDSIVRGLSALVLCGGLLALGPIACGGGGGGGGGGAPAASTEVRFEITSPDDMMIEGAATGVTGRSSTAPVRGPAVDF